MNKHLILLGMVLLGGECLAKPRDVYGPFDGSFSLVAGKEKSIHIKVKGCGMVSYVVESEGTIVRVIPEKANKSYFTTAELTPVKDWSWDSKKFVQGKKYGLGGTVYLCDKSECIDGVSILISDNIAFVELPDTATSSTDGIYYLGRSRLDDKKSVQMGAGATLDAILELPNSTYRWEPNFSPNWEYVPPEVLDKKNTSIQTCKGDVYSSTWGQETISGRVDGANGTTNFTIVAVDVQLGGLPEEDEESKGFLMTTNTPVPVKFKVLTAGLPKDLDKFTISCRDLYVESKAGNRMALCIPGKKGEPAKYYRPFAMPSSPLTAKDLTSSNFYIICQSPSQSWKGDKVVLSNISGAIDCACYTCYVVGFITPFGSPEKYQKGENGEPVRANTSSSEPADWYVKKETSEENDSGEGQNEFCFDDVTQELTIPLVVGVKPKLDVQTMKKLVGDKPGVFTVQKLRETSVGGTPKWDGGGTPTLSKNVMPSNGSFSATAVYTGYPNKSEGFGKYTATFTGLGRTITAEYEVFYPKKGIHHPTCTKCPQCPNWFYYWKDGAVPGLAADDVKYDANLNSKLFGRYDQNSSWRIIRERNENGSVSEGYYTTIANEIIRISDMASESGVAEYILQNQTTSNIVQTIVTGKPAQYVGVVMAAAACAHEKMHQRIYHGLVDEANRLKVITTDDKVDADKDGVVDTQEDAGTYGFVTVSSLSDSYGIGQADEGFDEYTKYGDNEINARLAERQAYGYNIFQDWAKPGCQSKDAFGPTREE